MRIPKSNQVSFGTKSLHIPGHTVWSASPFRIKFKENFQAVKDVTKFWDGSQLFV